MFKKTKPKLRTLAAESQQEEKKKVIDLRDADPNQVLAKYEKLRKNGDDIPVSILMYVGDLHRSLGRVDEALRLYGEGCRKAVGVESWTVAVQLLKKMQKAVNEPTAGMLQLSLQIALGQGMKTEAIRVLEKLGRNLAPRQGAEIEAVIGIIDRETKLDPDIEMALDEMLMALFRQDVATERMERYCQRAKMTGQKDLAKRFETRLLEIGWRPPSPKKADKRVDFGNMDSETIRGANFPKIEPMTPTPSSVQTKNQSPREEATEGKDPYTSRKTEIAPLAEVSRVIEVTEAKIASKSADAEIKRTTGIEQEGSINVTIIPPLAKFYPIDAQEAEARGIKPGPVIPVFIMPSAKPEEKEEVKEEAKDKVPKPASKDAGNVGLTLPPLSPISATPAKQGEDNTAKETKKTMPLPALATFSFPSRPLPNLPTKKAPSVGLPIEVPTTDVSSETVDNSDNLEDFFNNQEKKETREDNREAHTHGHTEANIEPLEPVEIIDPIEPIEPGEPGEPGEIEAGSSDTAELDDNAHKQKYLEHQAEEEEEASVEGPFEGSGEDARPWNASEAINIEDADTEEQTESMLEATELPESSNLIGIEDEEEPAELARPLPPAPTIKEMGGPESGETENEGEFINANDLFGPSDRQDNWGREVTRVVADELADLPVSDRDQVRALAGALMSGLRATIDPEDAQSHYDLGTAFLQMKLYQEASEAFQLAFRSPAFRTKSVEGLAQSFMEQNSAGLAYRIVKMVLPELPTGAGQIGAQYWLARAAEALGKKEEAKDLYAEISIQDINFADAAERLRALES